MMLRLLLVFSIVSEFGATGFLLNVSPNVRPSKCLVNTLALEKEIDLSLPYRENLNALEQEFRDKLAIFAAYSHDEISSIPNPRLRTLYEGVAASAHEPAVYRAFEVLFEDLMPLRAAGRMIFGRLAQNMDKQVDRRNELILMSGLPKEEIDRCRRILFKTLGSEDKLISQAQLKSIMSLAKECTGKDLVLPSKKRVAVDNVIVALSQVSSEPSAILETLETNDSNTKQDQKKAKFENRYRAMVQSFSEWEDYVPEEEGRLLDVLRGCFVGAKNEKVVEALMIVYVDYAALRMAGDLIFKLMSSLVNRSHN